MSIISNSLLELPHLERLKDYMKNPVAINGMEFISPLAIKALQKLKNSDNRNEDSNLRGHFSFNEELEKVWVKRIQEEGENLPLDTTEKLTRIFNAFPISNADLKGELVSELTKISHENNIYLFKIFEKALSDQNKLFDKSKLELKQKIKLVINLKLYEELLIWTKKTELERVTFIYEYHQLSPFSTFLTPLDKAKKEEIYSLKMRYFHLFKEVDQKIYSNNFLLKFYYEEEALWIEEIKVLIESNRICSAEKMALLEEQDKQLVSLDEKYEILIKEEAEKELKKQKKTLNPTINIPQTSPFNSNDQNKSDSSLDEINKLIVALEKKPKKRCIII